MVTPLSGGNFSGGEFSPFPTLAYPQPPVVGDFNGDGKLDLVVLTQQGLTVWLGDGNGGFAQRPAQQTPLELSIRGVTITVGDFDGDGNLDLAVPNNADEGIVAILLGDGKGGFTAAAGSPFRAGHHPLQAVAADFNLDGKPDLAISNNIASGGVIILLGDGMGGFTPGGFNVPVPIVAGEASFGLAVGDFNGDGKPDLAVADNLDSGMVIILLGDGTGGFQPAPNSPIAVGANPYLVVVGDFNLDGKLDLATANYGRGDVSGSGNVSVLLGDGAGGLTPAPGSPFAAGTNPLSLSIADFNGDGRPDLAVANFGDSSLTMLLGDGAGGFVSAPYNPLAVGTSPSVVSGDFNGDGVVDLATANYVDNTVTVLLGTTGLTISVSQGTGFAVNQNGIYGFTVTNLGTTASSGLVTVVDTLPPGLTPQTTITTGWNCSIAGQTMTCTREDSLPAGQSYPHIILLVQVKPAACPNASNVAEVVHGGRAVASSSIPVSGCLNVSQQSSNLIVGQRGSFILELQSVPGAINNGLVSVTVVIPAELNKISVNATPFWACSLTQNVVCGSRVQVAPEGGYPPISINFLVDPGACPFAIDNVQVYINGSSQTNTQFSNTVNGCLTVHPPRLNFPNSTLGISSAMTVTVTSTGFGQQAVIPQIRSGSTPPAFSLSTNCPAFLSLGDTCQVTVTSLYPCFGAQSTELSIVTNDSVSYTIPLTATGLPNTVSLVLDGSPLPASSTISPNQSHTASLTLSPSPLAGCTQTPALKLVFFMPSAPDKSSWDTSLNNDTLTTGTVAGTIMLEAVIGGVNIMAQDGSGSFTLKVPAQAGVVQSAAISNRTDSSFEIAVSGYSTPRNLNGGSTQVCFSFTPTADATLRAAPQFCALQEDIEIWYERPVSYKTGSQFQSDVTVSFSGAAKAIGQIKIWIANEVDVVPAPYCLDFESGASVSCQ
jgi:uncharacterized repeat protein (TIGR01451 family)